MYGSAGDCNDFVWKRSYAGAEHYPRAVFDIILLKFGKLRHISVHFQHRFGQQIEKRYADKISQTAAQNAGNRSQSGNFPCFVRSCQNHRNNHNIRRNRKKRAFGKSDDKQPKHRVFLRRKRQYTVVRFADKVHFQPQ